METPAEKFSRAFLKLGMADMLIRDEFTTLKKFKDQVEPYCQELDEKLYEHTREVISKMPRPKMRRLAESVFNVFERDRHVGLLYKSLALMIWHGVEEWLKRTIAWRGDMTRENQERWGFPHIRAYYKGAGYPLSNMPESNKIFTLQHIANAIKHRGGRATSRRHVPKYASEVGQPIKLTGAHLDEWCSACPVFLGEIVKLSSPRSE